MLDNTLSHAQIQRVAPSVFATQPHGRVTDKYGFVPTIKLVEAIEHSRKALTEHRKKTLQLIEARKAARVDLLNIEVRLADLMDTPFEQASVVVLNFTLQFVEPARRDSLLARIANGLLEGGVLLLSEKVCFKDPGEQALQTEWHHAFKRAQGYSDLEISRKRDALENVLVPESMERHRERLLGAGFHR